jgi:hypothetical protein
MASEVINKYTIYHIIIYMIFGYFFPNKWIYAITISFLWEIFEYILNIFVHSYSSFGAETLINRIIDIIYNLFGYYLGNNIKSIITLYSNTSNI